MRTSVETLDKLCEEKMDLTEVYTCDWKETPEQVLETVDAALEELGFEIETIESGQDCAAFRIVSRES